MSDTRRKSPRPVDLGYPTKPRGRIPVFHNVEEEAAFWDRHDITDYLEETEPAAITVGSELTDRLTVWLDEADRAELERRARRLGIGPSTLARMWRKERLREEAEAEQRSASFLTMPASVVV